MAFDTVGGTIWVCIDCLMADANGESPVNPDPTQPEPWALEWKFGEVTPGSIRDMNDDNASDDDDADHRDFSWSPCDGCGSTLGGSRHAYTYWTD